MLSREEYRKLKGFTKEEMDKFLTYERNMIYNNLRKEFNAAYKDELDCSIQNFLYAIAYTIRFNEDINMDNDGTCSFMEDLFVTVDLFRTGEYKPDDYAKELNEIGVVFDKYDYTKIYREKEGKYQIANQNALNYLNELIENGKTEFNIDDVDILKEMLGGK